MPTLNHGVFLGAPELADVSGLQTALDAKQDASEKDQPDGYAGLNPDGNLEAAVENLSDTAANLAAVAPSAGQFVYETDTKAAKVGDGTSNCAELPAVNEPTPISRVTHRSALFFVRTTNATPTPITLLSLPTDGSVLAYAVELTIGVTQEGDVGPGMTRKILGYVFWDTASWSVNDLGIAGTDEENMGLSKETDLSISSNTLRLTVTELLDEFPHQWFVKFDYTALLEA